MPTRVSRRLPRRRRTFRGRRLRTYIRRFRRVPRPHVIRNLKDPGGISNKAIVKLRYVDNRILNSTAVALGRHVFSCNSCYDPDLTGGGHQPIGFDEWSQFYTYYKVLGAKITVNAVNGTGEPQLIHVIRLDDPNPAGGMTALMEQPYGQWRALAGSLGGRSNTTIKHYYSAKKQFPNLYRDDTLRANIGANPLEQMYWVISSQRVDAAGTADIAVTVNIEYIVEFSVPKVLVQS